MEPLRSTGTISIMKRVAFSFADIEKDCPIETGCYQLGTHVFGARVHIPKNLFDQPPYNSTAYAFLQLLRNAILSYGTIEFPNLPVNPCNYTIKLKSPKEHLGNPNPFITDECQSPHQDTPPHPTAFWLDGERKFFATWIMNTEACNRFSQYQQQNAAMSVNDIHKVLVSESMQNGTGMLMNQQQGLLLLDNSDHHQLYHARTCNFKAVEKIPDYKKDSPMYAFNETGLLNYMNTLDIYRGEKHKSDSETANVKAFLANEKNFS